MFRQMIKLKQARRAFREGKFDEALRLAGDPDIRDHVKARKLKDACVEALAERAEKRRDRGDITLAGEDLEEVLHHGGKSEEMAQLEGDLQERRRARDEISERQRGLYYRARLDVERGELEAAVQTIEGVSRADRSEEMNALLHDVVKRMEAASKCVSEATALLGSSPDGAEELLVRAGRLDPRSAGVLKGWRDLATAKVHRAIGGDVPDAEFADAMTAHGMIKKTHLVGMDTSQEEEMDAPLLSALKERIRARMVAGDASPAGMLVDRHRDGLTGDMELAGMADGVTAFETATRSLKVGDIVGAIHELEKVEKAFGSFPAARELRKKADDLGGRVTPLFESAEQSLKKGQTTEAQKALLEVLDEIPRHERAKDLLDAVNNRRSDQEARLAEARRLVTKERVSEARTILMALRADNCQHGDISVLLDEIAVREKGAGTSPRKAPRRSQPGPEMSHRVVPDHDEPLLPVGRTWLLSVEELGEFLVLEQENVVIGNAVKRVADLPVLASIAPRHAQITRSASFHGGISYHLAALEDREVTVNGSRIDRVKLEDGDQVGLGRDLVLNFRIPSSKSRAALLSPEGDFDFGGAGAVILMPAGRTGSILLDGSGDSHVMTGDVSGDLEIYRNEDGPDGILMVRGTRGVEVDGDDARAENACHDGSTLVAGDVRCLVKSVVV